MLDPNYLLHISEGAEEIAEQLHTDIVDRIVERIMLRIGRGDDYILTAQDKWNIETLQQAGYLLEEIQKDIAKATKLQQTEIAEAMEDAGVKALEYDDKVYQSAGLSPTPLTQSPHLIRLMQRSYEATLGEWANFTRTTANSAQQLFIGELDRVYNLVASGAMSYTQALKEVINTVISDGVKVKYPTGHEDTIETATLRAVRTGISQATAQIQLARMDEMEEDLVIVSSHLGARPSHQEWQGKIYSRSGKMYPHFENSTGYGTVTGLCGANCRHSFGPYFEGMDNPYEQYDSEENKKQYEKEQKQRYLERRIRDTKRKTMNFKNSIDNCESETGKAALDSLYQKQAAALQQQKEYYKKYCKENGLKELNERLAVAKWNRKQAAAARGAAKRYEKNILKDNTGEWAEVAKKELLQDEKVLSVRDKETAVIYGPNGKFLFQKRGSNKEVQFTKSEVKRMKDGVITHNHPSGSSFSLEDINLFRESKASEIRVTTEKGVYFLRKPNKWPEAINTREKLKTERNSIAIEVKGKYNKLYKEGKITKAERLQMATAEINQKFAERFGLEYGQEAFED